MPKNFNEMVDDSLLYAVFRNAVNFLITDDKGLLIKSLRIDLSERVLSVDDALKIFRKKTLIEEVSHPPALAEEYCYNLDVSDEFFISFMNDYPEFNDWFKKISAEGRRCWVYRYEDGSIGALLIYKIESESLSKVNLPKKTRFKICSLKVVHNRHRLGELFIKLSIEYCINNEIEEIYLTVFDEKHEDLVILIRQYGFVNIGEIKRKEGLYLKKLVLDLHELPLNKIMLSTKYYPSFYDGGGVSKFLVPIQPHFHERLFTTYERQTNLGEYSGMMIIEGNSIKKAYLCHSPTTLIEPGDILLFYRSHDHRAITTLGVVEELQYDISDMEKILELVSRRTVYSIQEIEEMVKKNPLLIILFNYHFHFQYPIRYDTLIKNGALKGPPISIVKLSHGSYHKVIRMGGLNERYSIH